MHNVWLHHDSFGPLICKSLPIYCVEQLVVSSWERHLSSSQKVFFIDCAFDGRIARWTPDKASVLFVWCSTNTWSNFAVASSCALVTCHVRLHLVETHTVLLPVLTIENFGLNLFQLFKDHRIVFIYTFGLFLTIPLIKTAWPVLGMLLRSTLLVKAFLQRTVSSEYFVDAAQKLLISQHLLLVVLLLGQVFLELHSLRL